MPRPRRWIALGLALAAGLLTGSAPIASPAQDRLTLLGTGGGPIARIGRSQPSSMLETGGKTYLIDIGAGTERQVVRTGLRLNRVDGVFITHLHFDHTAGLAAFIALDWQDRRREPVAVHGPPGTRDLVANALRFLGSGEAIFRPQLPDLGPIAGLFSGTDHEVTAPAPIFSDGRLTVRAVENSHYGTMHLVPGDHGADRSYSYRFDTPERSILFTGDTGPSAAVERLGKDADLLVSEVIDLPVILESLKRRGTATAINQQPLIDHMAREHLTPENVGKLAAAAGVKKVILTHFAQPPGMEPINRKRILTGIRLHYKGPVAFGEDLASF